MRVIIHDRTDPAFNLAAEEYLLTHGTQDVFMLWRNDNAVIIGKNQNTWAEVNVPYTESHGITVVRRMTGGGAVFHDLGNVNFTYITAHDPARGIDFRPFIDPILRALAALGVQAEADGRNDIVVNGAKISGNAQCVHRLPDGTERLLHHGTLLFGADLSRLTEALRVSPEKIRSKGIASVRERVTNLRDVPGFPPHMTVQDFIHHLARTAVSGDAVMSPLTEEEIDGINALREEKYATWAWNFGSSARHDTENTVRFPFGTIHAAFSAVGGKIESIRLFGDYFGERPVAEMESALIGAPLRREDVADALAGLPAPVDAYIRGAQAEDIVSLIVH